MEVHHSFSCSGAVPAVCWRQLYTAPVVAIILWATPFHREKQTRARASCTHPFSHLVCAYARTAPMHTHTHNTHSTRTCSQGMATRGLKLENPLLGSGKLLHPMLSPAVRAVRAAHASQGVANRDLKLENTLLSDNSHRPLVKLAGGCA